MKKSLIAFLALSFLLSACGAIPGLGQTESSTAPTPISQQDLEATSAVFVQQTLDAQPTNTIVPSETPVIVAPTNTPTITATLPTPTETGVPALLTLTATLNAASATPGTAVVNPADGTATATIEAKPLTYGTLPPNLPYGTINLFNKAHVDVYISLRCVTKEGYVTLLEYPVNKTHKVSAPAGKYTYVAWVGGRQFDGSFSLDQDGYMTITFFKEKVNIKKN